MWRKLLRQNCRPSTPTGEWGLSVSDEVRPSVGDDSLELVDIRMFGLQVPTLGWAGALVPC